MKRTIRLVMMAAVLGCLGWYAYHARHDLAVIRRFNLLYLAPMLAVPLLSLWVNGLIAKVLVSEFEVRLSHFEAYALSTVNALGNYLPVPQAGAMARGVYLKRVHGLAYSPYAASLLVTYVSSIALSGLVGLAGLFVLQALHRPAPILLWVIFGGLALFGLMFTPMGKRLPSPRRLAGFTSGLAMLRGHHLLGRIALLQLILISLTATGLWLACQALPGGGDVNWFMGLMMGLLVMASGVANVTPGNLGVEQGAAMLGAHLLSIGPEVGFLASSLFRVMAIAVVFAIGPALAHWLTRQSPRASVQINSEAQAA